MSFFFQSIFSWAKPAMDGLTALCSSVGQWAGTWIPEGILRNLVVNGLFKGVGSVIAFLPQILILFFLLFLLEDIGYMARAAFLMDRLMGWAGLQGRSFIALISSYACAVPGIMATRTIPSEKDRLATMLSAPFMTCSARLPVYALLIGAFIPDKPIFGPLRLQGIVLLGLYLVGSVSALIAAWVLRSTMLRGELTPFYLELPPYRFPALKSVCLAMLDRGRIFLRRAGTIILGASLAICLLLSFPTATSDTGTSPAQAASRQMEYSIAGRVGHLVEPIFRPIGFDWRVDVALLGSLVAREIVVSTLAQIYAVDTATGGSLQQTLRSGTDPRTHEPLMTLPTALSLLAFFVYALQCLSTLAILRRETNGWKWPSFAFGYMFACAWIASFVVFHVARAFGL
jgi:ferrous iron transport protein B